MEDLLSEGTTTNDAPSEGTTDAAGTESGGATEETKVQEQAEEQAPQGAPEKYDLKPQEGQKFDDEFLKTYEETARDLNLTNEAAQKMIDKLGPVIEKTQLARVEAVRNEWTEASKSDKEFGGDKLKENLGVARDALEKFGSSELKEFLNTTGLGNHPEVIRMLYRAGKAIADDAFVGGQKQTDKPAKPQTFNDFANALYS